MAFYDKIELTDHLNQTFAEDVVSEVSSELTKNIMNFQVNVEPTDDIFKCNITLGEFDLDFDFDFLLKRRRNDIDLILLEKIKILRKYIVNINDIFIRVIVDLECCKFPDDMYNKHIVPIFRWLVEDENGLCGSLLRTSREIYKAVIPLKRLMCLIRPTPGNPFLAQAGFDSFKTFYSIVEGFDKVGDFLNNGSFLDMIIIPIKTFHDKLEACANGVKNDSSNNIIQDWKDILGGMVLELNESLASILNDSDNIYGYNRDGSGVASYDENAKFVPSPKPDLKGKSDTERIQIINKWNSEEQKRRKKFNDKIAASQKSASKKMADALKNKEKNILESTDLTVKINEENLKEKYKPVCGCLAEILHLDGIAIPEDYIVRTEGDLERLKGEVLFQGFGKGIYVTKPDGTKRVNIVTKETLPEIRIRPKSTNLAINIETWVELSTAGVINLKNKIEDFDDIEKLIIAVGKKSDFPTEVRSLFGADTEVLIQDPNNSTVESVIKLNKQFQGAIDTLTKRIATSTAKLSMLESAFYKKYLDEVRRINISNAKNKVLLNQNAYGSDAPRLQSLIANSNSQLQEYSIFPPFFWKLNPESISLTIGGTTYYYSEVEYYKKEIEYIKWEIKRYQLAIKRNHSAVAIVDNSLVECKCDIICQLIKYIIDTIMNLAKKIAMYLIQLLTEAILDKDLLWLLEFIMEKIQCILDILQIDKAVEDMKKRIDSEMAAMKNSIKELQSAALHCTDKDDGNYSPSNLRNDKASVNPDSLGKNKNDFPGFEDDTEKDVTPNTVISDVPNFDLNLDNVTFETNDWKDRVVPTLILDCTKDHKVEVNWKPNSMTWSAYLNLTLNYDQFNSSNEVVLKAPAEKTNAVRINELLDTQIVEILNALHNSSNGYSYKIELGSTQRQLNTVYTSMRDNILVTDTNEVPTNTIDKVYVNYENSWVKIFDKHQMDNLDAYRQEFQKSINELIENLEPEKLEIEEPEEAPNKKPCGLGSLEILSFKAIYEDKKSPLYYGNIELVELYDQYGYVYYEYKYNPLDYKNNKFVKPNVPFLIEIENNMGRNIKLVLLIDVCEPDNVMRTSYVKERDGVFLGGRYDYYKFDSIANNNPVVWTKKDILKKIKKYFEDIGMISNDFIGGSLGLDSSSDDNVLDNGANKTEYLDGFGPEDRENEAIASTSPINSNASLNSIVVNSNNKAEELKNITENLTKKMEDMFAELENIVESDNLDTSGNNLDFARNLVDVSLKDSKLGIPLIVLNEEENIILTIHEKKLKLLNVNRNFGAMSPDLVIEDEIDYRPGENLFIEYKTNGISHTISWINARKIVKSESSSVLTNADVKITTVGSIYKDKQPIALMCGKINDIILTPYDKPVEDWFAHSNTFRPSSTLGYYDFSLFDGYNVYSVPETIKVIPIENATTLKGLLYYNVSYTKAQIDQMIQEQSLENIIGTNIAIYGEKPITVGGDYLWRNHKYYKNISFGYLENFFCRDNLIGRDMTMSFWLKFKHAPSYNKDSFQRQYIIVDSNNGNFVWWEDNKIFIQLFGNPLRSENCELIFKKDINSIEPEYVEKWFHHSFRYNKQESKVIYTITSIDQNRNFDIQYSPTILDTKVINIPLRNIPGRGKIMDFSLVSMLARYDVKELKYTDYACAEIASLAIFAECKSDQYLNNLIEYQRQIIQSEF